MRSVEMHVHDAVWPDLNLETLVSVEPPQSHLQNHLPSLNEMGVRRPNFWPRISMTREGLEE